VQLLLIIALNMLCPLYFRLGSKIPLLSVQRSLEAIKRVFFNKQQ